MDENMVESTSVDTQPVAMEVPDTSYNEPEQSYENNQAPESTEEQTVATAETEDGGSMSVVIDPVTGKRSIKFGDDEPAEPQATEDTQEDYQEDGEGYVTEGINQGQQVVNNVGKYNLDEFSAALANGRVDPSRVPQEYQAQYADYRIRQAIAERQAQQQAAYQQEQYQRQQIAQQMSPENRVQANRDFFRGLDEEAGKAALKDLGMTQEEYDDAEFADDGDEIRRDYENAKAWHTQRLRNEMQTRYQQEQAYRAQQQNVYANLQDFVAQERAKEPNFDAIDRTLTTRYKNLPYEEGRRVEAALAALNAGTINQQGLEVIEKYWNDSRKEYYAKRNGLQPNGKATRRPPVVENAGNGQQVNTSYKPNYKNLRKADVDQRSAWFAEYFKNNGW